MMAMIPNRRQIVLAHGGGGQLTDELVAEFIRPRFQNPVLARLEDAALVLVEHAGRIALTTDSYVVQPLEFPGGDIGRLAICGTVNDLAVSGAQPRWLSLSLIIEEGLDLAVLGRVLDSAAAAAREAGVQVVTGDTKVVARGQADGLYINTAGVGTLRSGVLLGAERIRPGDAILINGSIADHGMAVMLQREDASALQSTLQSDVAPLADLIAQVTEASPGVRFMRDPTRGGVAGVVADLAERSGFRILLDEAALPLRRDTRYAAEMLGIDPLDVANEGKVIIVTPADEAERALEALRSHPLGTEARLIGSVGHARDGICELLTAAGGRRMVQKPYGEQLPRIC